MNGWMNHVSSFSLGCFSLKYDPTWSFWNYVSETLRAAERQSEIYQDWNRNPVRRRQPKLPFPSGFSQAWIVHSNVCLQQQNKVSSPFPRRVFFSPQPDPVVRQPAPFIDQHKVPNKWAQNESYAPGSSGELELHRFPSILITALMKRLLSAGCP